jgi:tetratricopeptide (TPR) repeat protein
VSAICPSCQRRFEQPPTDGRCPEDGSTLIEVRQSTPPLAPLFDLVVLEPTFAPPPAGPAPSASSSSSLPSPSASSLPSAAAGPEPARAQAEAAFAAGDLDGALKLFRAVLFQFERQLAAGERADLYERMGRIKTRQNDPRQALNLFEKALALDAEHRGSLEGLVELSAGVKDFPALLEAHRRLAGILGGADRIRHLLAAGDTALAELNDVPQACLMYQEALAIDPDDRTAHLKLLQACRQAELWPEAIAACEGLLAHESDAGKRATWRFFLATTFRDQVQDEERAAAEFERVLDDDPDDAESLAALERIHVAAPDWPALEQSWLRQVARLAAPGAAPRREQLLVKLGELAHGSLHDLDKAAGYYARALELAPENLARRDLLARLYAAIPGRWADAVREHQRLLRADPKRIDSYHAMRAVLRDAGKADEVWCVCAALVQLDRADPTERQFYEQYRPKGAVTAVGTVDVEAWRDELYHPEQDRDLSQLLAATAPAAVRAFAQAQKAVGLRKKDQQDVQTSPLALAKALRSAGATLELPVPELYVVPHQQGGLIVAGTEPAASVAGQDFLAGLTPAELRFVAARHLTAYRREHVVPYLLAAVAAAERKPFGPLFAGWVDAALLVGEPRADVARTPEVQQLMKRIQAALQPLELELLREAARRLAGRGDRLLAAWLRGADLTGDRAGLLLCGDLPTAARLLARTPAFAPDLSEARRADELLVFGVGDSFFRLRRRLGLALPEE